MANLLGVRTGLALMDDQPNFDRVANAIHLKDGLDRETAGKALDQAVIFIHAAGRHHNLGLSPSEIVDKAWDRLIQYTMIYSGLCQRLCGRYIHHTPMDAAPVHVPKGFTILTPFQTFELLRQDGYWVHEELWPADSLAEAKANCVGTCYSGDHEGESTGPTP